MEQRCNKYVNNLYNKYMDECKELNKIYNYCSKKWLDNRHTYANSQYYYRIMTFVSGRIKQNLSIIQSLDIEYRNIMGI